MSFRLHGNYCGPGWSAGKWQSSVSTGPKPVDSLDWACARHDAAYANSGDRSDADMTFARDAFATLTPLGVAAGIGVGLQGVARRVGILSRGPDTLSIKPINHSQTNRKSRDMARGRIQRGIQAKSRLAEIQLSRTRYPPTNDAAAIAEIKSAVGQFKKKVGQQAARFRRSNRVSPGPFGEAVVNTAPVSIGTTVTGSRPTVVSTSDGVRITGREFMTNVDIRGNASWQVGAIAPVHPMYYPGSVMGNMARTYQYYRVAALRVHFVTRQTTSLAGEVLLAYASNALEPAENGNGSAFLARSMTRGHAVLAPLWQNCSMDVPIDPKWRLVDAFNASTFAENVAGELQVYTQTAATNDVAGYLLMDYVLEFKETMFTPHSTALPFTTAAATAELGTTLASASGAAFVVSSTLAAASASGTICRLILDVDQSTFGTGANASNLLSTSARYNSTTTTSATSTITIGLTDGIALYGVVVGNSFYIYSSYDAAVNGEGSGQVFVNTTFTTLNTLAYYTYVVRLPDRTLMIAN